MIMRKGTATITGKETAAAIITEKETAEAITDTAGETAASAKNGTNGKMQRKNRQKAGGFCACQGCKSW
mgnify:CR=1 FL=1